MASSNTSSNTSATPLLSGSDSSSLGDSQIQVIVVSPAVVQETEEGERNDSTTVEVVMNSTQQAQEQERPRGEREGERGQNGHIVVDVEGLGHLHPAPVVNA